MIPVSLRYLLSLPCQGLGKEAFQAFLAAKAKRHLPDESGRSQSAVQPRHGGRLDRSRCSDQLFAKCLGASSQDMDDEVRWGMHTEQA